MKKAGTHEGCIEQMCRLFAEKLGKYDSEGYIRLDDLELAPEIQKEVAKAWKAVNTQNLADYADIDGYWDDFYRMFGFKCDGVDYSADVEPNVAIQEA